MSFASLDFLVFFSAVLLGTAVLERRFPSSAKEGFLLLASFFFYGYWDWRFCFLLLFVTLASYFSAKHAQKKAAYLLGLTVPLVVLGFFKYFNFFLESFSALAGRQADALRIILPVGISFYTFQALSYVIDVHRGKIPAETSFLRLALYISFFPQLVAGPIVRASDFLPQLREGRRVTWDNCKWGVQVFAFGLFKKIVLADHLSVFADDIFRMPSAFCWTTLLLGTLAYSMQIYFDFSGYSDMAIGCAKCLGYDFNRNFDLPYCSADITEFWRRWHISLSSWLREYLYIPLGGNRKGEKRRIVNLMITMLLGGLWHGANWTFVFWGALHGLALCADKALSKRRKPRAPRALRILVTFVFVNFAWVFFRADSFATAAAVLRGIFTLQAGIRQPQIWAFVSLGFLILASYAAVRRAKKTGAELHGYYPILDLESVWGLTLFFVELGLILALAFTGEAPFVYFQF